MTHEGAHPARANVSASSTTPEEMGGKWGAFAGHMEALRQNEAIAALSEQERGRVIADRYVGAVVAAQTRGYLRDSVGRGFTSVNDVFRRVNHAAKAENKKATIRDTFPDVSGLKVGTTILLEDEATAPFMLTLAGRVKENGHGQVTMTSAEQVVGYTEAVANGVYKPWQKPILEEVERCMEQNLTEPNPKWDTPYEYSEVGLVQSDRSEWQRTVDDARQDGVDFSMLTRSLNRIHQEVQGGDPYSGKMMADPVTPQVPSYDQFFQP